MRRVIDANSAADHPEGQALCARAGIEPRHVVRIEIEGVQHSFYGRAPEWDGPDVLLRSVALDPMADEHIRRTFGGAS